MNNGSELKKQILLVDDHAIVRQGLRNLIEAASDLEVCGEGANREDALKGCDTQNPDLVVIDLCLGQDSGLALIKDVTVQHPDVKVLVFSMQDELFYAERVLRAGASGYLSKEEKPELLVQAIRSVLDGNIYVSDRVSQQIVQSVRRSDTARDPVEQLSDRELSVFESIGKGRSTAEIAEALQLSVKTVETYRSRIKSKLNLSSSAKLLQYALQRSGDSTI